MRLLSSRGLQIFRSIYSASHSDAVQHYIMRCRGTAVPIGVNLSSNVYSTGVLPHPNPPLYKGRELDFLVSPLYKGGLRGVKRLWNKRLSLS